MNSNIFVKLNVKSNPDIEPKMKDYNITRKNEKFTQSTTIYNPITGVVPNKIKTAQDLALERDDKISNIKKLIAEKESERKKQDETYKPVQTKIINNNPIVQSDVVPDKPSEKPLENLQNFNDIKAVAKKANTQTKAQSDILDSLISLGIIKQ